MAERPKCPLCETRKPKRICPGISGEICPQCCGSEREQSIRCPLDCGYLLESRRHDPSPKFDLDTLPHRDIVVDEAFTNENQYLFNVVSLAVIQAAHYTPGVVDNDVRECLEAVITTYLARGSGIIYESKPANAVAAAMQSRLMNGLEDFKKLAFEKTGVHSVKDPDLLKIFVFTQRLELTMNNGRRYGRAFLWALRKAFNVYAPDNHAPVPGSPSSLII